MSSCKPKNEPEIDPRQKFVGVYNLNVSSDVSLYDGKTYYPYDMSAKNKSFAVTIDPSSTNKCNISGYYGKCSATYRDDKLYLPSDYISQNIGGIQVMITYQHAAASTSGTRITWTTNATLSATGSAGVLSGSGTLTNVATKLD